MENQNQHTQKVFGYFRVGTKSQLNADWPQPSTEKKPLDNQSDDTDDIDTKESDRIPDMQMGG